MHLGLTDALEQYERELIAEALAYHGWRLRPTARDLQVDPSNLLRRIKRLGLYPTYRLRCPQ